MSDFPDDSAFFIQAASNANVTIGSETVRGSYSAPSGNVGVFNEMVDSADPQVCLAQSDVNRLGVKNGTAMSITPDGSNVPISYIVKQANGDGAGLVPCTLKKDRS